MWEIGWSLWLGPSWCAVVIDVHAAWSYTRKCPCDGFLAASWILYAGLWLVSARR